MKKVTEEINWNKIFSHVVTMKTDRVNWYYPETESNVYNKQLYMHS